MKKYMVVVFLGLMAACWLGCAKRAGQPAEDRPPRFTLTSEVRFYSGEREREVLLIVDTKTGREYIAVMGAGVRSLRVEGSGKDRKEVED